MSSRLVYCFAAITHACDPLAAADPLAVADGNFTEVPVEAVIRGTIPQVLNHDISSVIGIARYLVSVHHLPLRNRSDFIQGLTPRVPMKTFNIDAFVKSRVDNSIHRLNGIADESVAPPFPWG